MAKSSDTHTDQRRLQHGTPKNIANEPQKTVAAALASGKAQITKAKAK